MNWGPSFVEASIVRGANVTSIFVVMGLPFSGTLTKAPNE